MKRRKYLIGLGCLATSGVAGCVGDEEEDCDEVLIMKTSSMEPTISEGAELCIEEMESYKSGDETNESGLVGEVVVYEHPEDDERYVVSRVMDWDDSVYVTKGDSEPIPDPWDVPPEIIDGVVIDYA